MEKMIIFFIRKTPLVAISLIIYIGFIRPIRVTLAENMFKPIFNKANIEVVNTLDLETELSVKIKEKRIPLNMPFGAYFWPPAVLLFLTKSFDKLKIFTKYHLIITLIIPFILLMPVLNNVWST